jgi:2-polyprenyl-6-methoxyphenol hydroxylase-like FAD-dependent oxidoreductase
MGRSAVVIGGSMAGMCAARVLADHFDQVTLVDRDSYPTGVEHRLGVPQSHHAHALLARGLVELERLFPGFERGLLERGAQKLDPNQDFAILRQWGWAPRRPSGLESLWASRPLVDAVVREKLRLLPNIESRERASVIGLRIERAQRARVSGVTIRRDGESETLAADLVVDASGRGSKAPAWFEAAGLARPKEEVVEAFAGYASRFYRRPPAERRPKDWWWKGLWIEGIPPTFPRGGLAIPIENDMWLATAVGFGKDYPPADEPGFLAFLGTLASPIIAKALAHAEPLSDIVVNRSTTNRFRHYESWDVELDGFLALGDSVCAFNPVYGQGMSTAAVSAAELATAIKTVGTSPEALPRAHFAAQARFLTSVWSLAAGADFIWPATMGDRPAGSALMRPYLRLLTESIHCDPALMRRMVRVMHLLDHPSGAATPAVIGAVLQSTIKRRLREGRPSVARGSMPPTFAALD